MVQMNGVDMRTTLGALTAAVVIGGLVSCSENNSSGPPSAEVKASQITTQIFAVKGVVKELQPEDRTIVVKHEKIQDYMPAMTMPFEVKTTNELAGLKPGDEVSFRLLVTQKDGWVDQIAKTGSTNVAEPPPETFRRVRLVEPLNVGDVMPDYPFTNELGQAIHLADFKGQALAFTFMYTRCPLPNFCPRMSENFAETARKLAGLPDGPKKWHLLSISFDPEHDRPDVLKNYAKRYEPDTNHWDFATGALIDIDAITEQFGLMFPREGGGFIFNHNLRTVVVDAQGKVQKVFTGNQWKADELVEEMVKAAAAK
jgi:protein SCO1/2